MIGTSELYVSLLHREVIIMNKVLLCVGNIMMFGGGIIALIGVIIMALIQNNLIASIPMDVQGGIVAVGIIIAALGYAPAYLGSKRVNRE